MIAAAVLGAAGAFEISARAPRLRQVGVDGGKSLPAPSAIGQMSPRPLAPVDIVEHCHAKLFARSPRDALRLEAINTLVIVASERGVADDAAVAGSTGSAAPPPDVSAGASALFDPISAVNAFATTHTLFASFAAQHHHPHLQRSHVLMCRGLVDSEANC